MGTARRATLYWPRTRGAKCAEGWMLFSSASVLLFKRHGTPRLVTCPSARWSDTANFLAASQLQPQDVFFNTMKGSTQSHHPAGNFAPHPCAQWTLLDPHGRRTKLEAIGRMCYIIACTTDTGTDPCPSLCAAVSTPHGQSLCTSKHSARAPLRQASDRPSADAGIAPRPSHLACAISLRTVDLWLSQYTLRQA